MTLGNLIGYLLLAIPYIVLVALAYYVEGRSAIILALVSAGAVVLILGLIALGVYLALDEK